MSKSSVTSQENNNTYSALKTRASDPHTSSTFLPANHQPLVSRLQPDSNLAKPLAQPKLKIAAPGDQYEQEADRVAEQVLRMPEPRFGMSGPAAPSDPKGNSPSGLVQRSHAFHSSESAQVPAVTPDIASGIRSLNGDGQKLSEADRDYFEPRFGHDLSQVRIHNGSYAADMASRINAKAFTFGRDIVFGPGQFQPGNRAGQRLLAHELTHVLQQDRHHIRREPYETRGIALSRTQITTMAGQSYWEQRTFQAYNTTLATTRLSSNAEERDAVFSTLWGMSPPTTVTSHREMIVPIAARTVPSSGGGASTQASELLYRFSFDPPAPGDARPRLEISFIASGSGSTPIEAPSAPATYHPSQPALSFQGFPSGGSQPGAYWQAHPDEHRALFQWIETQAPASFDQVITTVTRQQGNVTHQTLFHVSGSHSGTTISSLSLNLVSQQGVASRQVVPADYRDRDMGDLELERLRDSSRAAADRLGTIVMPAGLVADERLAVKYSIWQYFDSGQARNTEVDAIVPVGTGSRSVLYTFIFGVNNEVTAIRIGESGSATGQVDTQRIDVSRVRGFPGNSATPAALRTWWSARYPHGGALTPDPPAAAPGQPAAQPISSTALISDMNRLITAGIRNRNWFDQNYHIEVLDAQGTANRLQTAHNAPANIVTDTIDFTPTDLRMLELSLQTLSDDELAHLNGVKLGRKTASITRNGANYQAGGAGQYGLTLMDSTGGTMERTTLFFQSLYANNQSLFRGSTAAGALPEVTMGILHELGHAAGYDAGIETAFTAWLAQHPQAAPTWYAASGTSERLPEFFALYHTDPFFVCNRYPLVYAWFEALATTGNPPAANASLSAPASCPPGPRVFIRVSSNSTWAQVIQANNLAAQSISEADLKRLNPELAASTTINAGTQVWLRAREVAAMENGLEATVTRYFGDRFRWPAVWGFNPNIRDPAAVQPTTRIHLQSAADRTRFGEVLVN